MKPTLLAASAIVAMLDRRERQHQAVKEVVEKTTAPLVTCEAAIAEACYLLQDIWGAKDAVIANVEAGVFHIPIRLDQAAPGIRQILRKYRDREVDLADACLIHLATQLKTGDILTLDGDFRVYRWGANKPFHMLVA